MGRIILVYEYQALRASDIPMDDYAERQKSKPVSAP